LWDLGIDGRIILELFPNKGDYRVWTGVVCFSLVVGYDEHGKMGSPHAPQKVENDVAG
jgi:hypothetical protein